MKILLAPDVYVNASVAGAGFAPAQVVDRVLGNQKHRHQTTEWILSTTTAMLSAHPHFKKESVEPQMKLIRDLVDLVEPEEHDPESWEESLVAAAKAVEVERVITDHPDLADTVEVEGIEFLSSDAWMIEQQTPPPPPPPPKTD